MRCSLFGNSLSRGGTRQMIVGLLDTTAKLHPKRLKKLKEGSKRQTSYEKLGNKIPGGGGALTYMSSTGMCRGKDPTIFFWLCTFLSLP